MGVLIRKQGGVPVFTGIAKIAIVLLIVSFAYSLVDTIWAVYMESLVKNVSYVSFLSAFFTIIAFFSFFIIIPIVEKSKKSTLFSLSLILIAVTYILFAINKNFYIFIIIACILTFLTSLRITSFGIIIRDKSNEKKLCRNEGLVYTFLNIAWVIGPLIAGYIAQSYGIPVIFILSGIFIFIAFFVFKISKIYDSNIKKKVDINIIKNFFSFFKSRNRVMAYIVGGGASFWLILIYLYMPILIMRSGLNKIWIGYFLFAHAVPLILFEYGAAKWAGKAGFRKVFKAGFFIIFLFTAAAFFVTNIYLIMVLLVFASIGLAMVEPTIEAYFFDVLKTKEEESKYYGPYNTAIDSAHFVGKLLAGIMLIFAPFKFIFLFFALFMFFYFLITFKIKEVKEYLRRE